MVLRHRTYVGNVPGSHIGGRPSADDCIPDTHLPGSAKRVPRTFFLFNLMQYTDRSRDMQANQPEVNLGSQQHHAVIIIQSFHL